jgi:hypothetical protein
MERQDSTFARPNPLGRPDPKPPTMPLRFSEIVWKVGGNRVLAAFPPRLPWQPQCRRRPGIASLEVTLPASARRLSWTTATTRLTGHPWRAGIVGIAGRFWVIL